MRHAIRSAFTAALLAFPRLAAAHPGHGVDPSGTSLWHYIGSPEHALPLLAAIAAALLFRVLGAERRNPS